MTTDFLCQDITKYSITELLNKSNKFFNTYNTIKSQSNISIEQKFFMVMFEVAINPNRPPVELKEVFKIENSNGEIETITAIKTKAGLSKDIIAKINKPSKYIPRYTVEEYATCKIKLKLATTPAERLYWKEVCDDKKNFIRKTSAENKTKTDALDELKVLKTQASSLGISLEDLISVKSTTSNKKQKLLSISFNSKDYLELSNSDKILFVNIHLNKI